MSVYIDKYDQGKILKQYKATCAVCNCTNESDNLNDSVLDLVHHPECDERKGLPWIPQIDDRRFSE